MGSLWTDEIGHIDLRRYSTFEPRFTRAKDEVSVPLVFPFREFILQALVRDRLADADVLRSLLADIGADIASPDGLEVLGEKALPQGNVDLLIKEATPAGIVKKIVLELKLGSATKSDVDQAITYRKELGGECVASALVAREFGPTVRRLAKENGVKLVPTYLNQRNIV